MNSSPIAMPKARSAINALVGRMFEENKGIIVGRLLCQKPFVSRIRARYSG
jgi:hypothetical protein